MRRTTTTLLAALTAGGLLLAGFAPAAQARATPAYDLKLANDSGSRVTAGNPRTGIALGLDVENNGSAKPRPQLVLAVRPGWRVKPDAAYTNIRCTVAKASGRSIATCTDRNPVPRNTVRYEAITLYPPAKAAVGVVHDVRIRVSSVGHADEAPADNRVTVKVVNRGIADLGVTVRTTATRLAKGGRTGLTVRLTNHGPNTATDLGVLIHPDGKYSTRRIELSRPKGPGVFGFGSAGADAPATLAWDLPPLKSGRSVVATIRVTGVRAGTVHVVADTYESAGDPGARSLQGGRYESTRVLSRTITVRG